MKYQTEMRIGIALLVLGFVMQILLIAANLDRVEAGGIVKSMTPTPTRTLTSTASPTATFNRSFNVQDPTLTPFSTYEGRSFPPDQCIFLICKGIRNLPPVCPPPPPVTMDLLCRNIWTPTPGGD